MADDADKADEFIEQQVDRSLAMIAKQMERINENPTHCICCNEEIPQARRELSFYVDKCATCKADSERRQGH